MKIKLIKFIIFQSLIFILISCSQESENAAVPIPAANKVENINNLSDLSKVYDGALHGIVAIRIDTVMGPAGSGSGFIWDSEGRIATNSHVVRESESFPSSEIIVSFYDGYEFKANLIAHDVYSDLAILDVEYPDFYEIKPLPL